MAAFVATNTTWIGKGVHRRVYSYYDPVDGHDLYEDRPRGDEYNFDYLNRKMVMETRAFYGLTKSSKAGLEYGKATREDRDPEVHRAQQREYRAKDRMTGE